MNDPSDPFQLKRFLDAQEQNIGIALTELRAGRKEGHWMWYVFPQLAGLGRSPTSQFYGIKSLGEAKAFLANPLLGQRYRDAVGAIGAWAGKRSAASMLGTVDAMKLRSSLTLFEIASNDSAFSNALDAFFGGPDGETLRILARL